MRGIAALGILAVTVVSGVAGSAGAADDPMVVYYGNTLMVQNQPLYIMRTWFNPDHRFMQFRGSNETTEEFSKMPRLAGFQGNWEVKGDQLCMTYDKEPAAASLPPPTPGCRPLIPHQLGEVWKVSPAEGPYKGTTEIYTISKGHNTES